MLSSIHHSSHLPDSSGSNPMTRSSSKRKIVQTEPYSPSHYDQARPLKKRVKSEPLENRLLTVNEAKKLTPIKKVPVRLNPQTQEIELVFSPASKKELKKQQGKAKAGQHPKKNLFLSF